MQWANNRIGVPGSIRPIIILVLDLRSIRVAGSLPPVLRSALYGVCTVALDFVSMCE